MTSPFACKSKASRLILVFACLCFQRTLLPELRAVPGDRLARLRTVFAEIDGHVSQAHPSTLRMLAETARFFMQKPFQVMTNTCELSVATLCMSGRDCLA